VYQHLRAQLLPEKQCIEIQTLLHKYLDIRAGVRKEKRIEDPANNPDENIMFGSRRHLQFQRISQSLIAENRSI
jgi:hypothetical protein